MKELDLGAVSGVYGDFHLPRISGNTVKGSLRECAEFWREELSTMGIRYCHK